jgi:hypothetical protein
MACSPHCSACLQRECQSLDCQARISFDDIDCHLLCGISPAPFAREGVSLGALLHYFAHEPPIALSAPLPIKTKLGEDPAVFQPGDLRPFPDTAGIAAPRIVLRLRCSVLID